MTVDLPPIYEKAMRGAWAQDPHLRPSFEEIVGLLSNSEAAVLSFA